MLIEGGLSAEDGRLIEEGWLLIKEGGWLIEEGGLSGNNLERKGSVLKWKKGHFVEFPKKMLATMVGQ